MLSRLFDQILNALAAVVGGILLYIVGTVTFDVIMRYVFNRPTQWAVTFSEYALLYIAFMSAAWVLAKDRHVKVDILLSILPPGTQRILNISTSVIGATVCAIFFWYAACSTWTVFQTSDKLWHAITILKWPIWIAMPIGSLLLTIQFIRRAWFYAGEIR